uniref:Tubulin epsilon and delta complex protein 1 domain-containing protein n=1 Tax=Leptobrachium leishanense TaxID=445787 RepID=A0A8C5MNK0_9ANUR
QRWPTLATPASLKLFPPKRKQRRLPLLSNGAASESRRQDEERGEACAQGGSVRAVPLAPRRRLEPGNLPESQVQPPGGHPRVLEVAALLVEADVSREIPLSPGSDIQTVEKQAKCVKCILRCRGYGRRAFFHLPCDGSEGSRELLIAFSWILRKLKPLEKFLETNRVRFGDRIDGCTISSYTQGCHFDPKQKHLTSVEVGLIRHPEKAAQVLESLVSESARLEAYLEWKQVEAMFWVWMDRILVSDSPDEPITLREDAPTMTASPRYRTSSLYDDIQKMDHDLAELQAHLKGEVARKKSAWQGQIKEMANRLDEKEMNLMGKTSKREAQARAHDLLQTSRNKAALGLFTLHFNDCSTAKRWPRRGEPRDLQVAELISRLQRAEAELETEIHVLQEECRSRLDDAIEEYDGVICIPPPKT